MAKFRQLAILVIFSGYFVARLDVFEYLSAVPFWNPANLRVILP